MMAPVITIICLYYNENGHMTSVTTYVTIGYCYETNEIIILYLSTLEVLLFINSRSAMSWVMFYPVSSTLVAALRGVFVTIWYYLNPSMTELLSICL